MSKTPTQAFNDLLQRLVPSPSERTRADSHAEAIRGRLVKAFGASSRVMLVGSHARDTAVRNQSDVDYFAVLPIPEARFADRWVRSGSFMEKLRGELGGRFSRTDISRDAQAIVLHFNNGDRPVDIVPSIFYEMLSGDQIFYIPSGDGTHWIRSSPGAHNRYLIQADLASEGKLSRTTRLVKHWKHARQSPIPLLSFHAEMLLACTGICIGSRSYQNILFDFFDQLEERRGVGLDDPLSISTGPIELASTEAQRMEILRAARWSRERVRQAIAYELDRQIAPAIDQWSLVFNGDFPS